MRLELAVVLPCLVAGVVVEPHRIEGSISKFKAESLTDDKQWTAEIYDNCRQYYDNTFVSKDSPCVSALLKTTPYRSDHCASRRRECDTGRRRQGIRNQTEA